MLAVEPREAREAWRDMFPRLWSLLTQGRDDEGRHVQTGTLLVFLEEGRIKLCLHDRERCRVAFLTVSGLPQGFAELEDALLRGTLDWRVKKPFPGPRTNHPLATKRRAP
jgi:hypothetical protein